MNDFKSTFYFQKNFSFGKRCFTWPENTFDRPKWPLLQKG